MLYLYCHCCGAPLLQAEFDLATTPGQEQLCFPCLARMEQMRKQPLRVTVDLEPNQETQ